MLSCASTLDILRLSVIFGWLGNLSITSSLGKKDGSGNELFLTQKFWPQQFCRNYGGENFQKEPGFALLDSDVLIKAKQTLAIALHSLRERWRWFVGSLWNNSPLAPCFWSPIPKYFLHHQSSSKENHRKAGLFWGAFSTCPKRRLLKM